MRQYIEAAERTLAQHRGRVPHRDKGCRPAVRKTVTGGVEDQRHVRLLSGTAEQHKAAACLRDKGDIKKMSQKLKKGLTKDVS